MIMLPNQASVLCSLYLDQFAPCRETCESGRDEKTFLSWGRHQTYLLVLVPLSTGDWHFLSPLLLLEGQQDLVEGGQLLVVVVVATGGGGGHHRQRRSHRVRSPPPLGHHELLLKISPHAANLAPLCAKNLFLPKPAVKIVRSLYVT